MHPVERWWFVVHDSKTFKLKKKWRTEFEKLQIYLNSKLSLQGNQIYIHVLHRYYDIIYLYHTSFQHESPKRPVGLYGTMIRKCHVILHRS